MFMMAQSLPCRLLIGAVLAVAAAFKLMGSDQVDAMIAPGEGAFLPRGGILTVAGIELMMAAWLASPFWKRSLTWVQLLILGMIAVSVTIWLRGDSPTACGCFGQTPIPWTGHFLILLGLVASLGHLQAIRGRLART